MDPTLEKIIEAVQRLPEVDQIALADSIYMKCNVPWSEDLDLAEGWDEEIAERLRQIDAGEVEMIPWEQVAKEMRELLDDPD